MNGVDACPCSLAWMLLAPSHTDLPAAALCVISPHFCIQVPKPPVRAGCYGNGEDEAGGHDCGGCS